MKNVNMRPSINICTIQYYDHTSIPFIPAESSLRIFDCNECWLCDTSRCFTVRDGQHCRSCQHLTSLIGQFPTNNEDILINCWDRQSHNLTSQWTWLLLISSRPRPNWQFPQYFLINPDFPQHIFHTSLFLII